MISEDHLLYLNAARVMRCLGHVLAPAQIGKIEAEMYGHVRQLMDLSRIHLTYARRVQGRAAWRQRVSRGYYACYNASKALRLAVSGVFSSDVTDHKKVGELPDGFPEKNAWLDFLTKFRADRNLADYDHAAQARDLELAPSEYLDEARRFVGLAEQFLRARGVYVP